MSDRPQYPSYPGDGEPAGGQPPPGYGYPPPPPSQPPPYGYVPQGYAPQGQPPQGYGYPPNPPRSNGMAITSLVLGILSIVSCWLGVVLGILAVVFSIVARKQISAQAPGTMTGTGMATAGLVTGIVGTLIWGGIIALMVVDSTVGW